MTFSENVGQNIRNWRRLKDIKQDTLAEKIHLDKSTLSKIENGLTDANLPILQKIADALEITPEQLLFANPKNIVFNANVPQNYHDQNIEYFSTQHLLSEEAKKIIYELLEQLKEKEKQIAFMQSLIPKSH